jgi:hypothetical protein
MEKKSRQKRKAANLAPQRQVKKPQNNTAPPAVTMNDQDLYERVARKAYELYQQRGEEHGHDLEDWLIAQRLVQEELLHGPLSDELLSEEGKM